MRCSRSENTWGLDTIREKSIIVAGSLKTFAWEPGMAGLLTISFLQCTTSNPAVALAASCLTSSGVILQPLARREELPPRDPNISHKFLRLAALTGFLVLAPVLVLGSGTLRGRVTDEQTGEPLVGANVVVMGTSFGVMTDQEGEFSLVNVPVGPQSVKATYVGYIPVVRENVLVYNDLTTRSDFQLAPSAISLGAVTVIAERPLVNRGATNALRIMTQEDIDAKPIRGLDNLLALSPGVTLQDGNIYVRGGRVDETGYYLEGVPIADPLMGGRGVSINQNALEEIAVRSGGYEAEYGRANAGIVQHQLRTGGSDFSGSVEFITDNLGLYPKSSWSDGRTRLGSTWFGYNEFTATLAGPVEGQRFRFFSLLNYGYEADRHPTYYPGISVGPVKDPISADSIDFSYPAGILLKNSEEHAALTGTLQLDLYPLILRLSGSYTASRSFTGGLPANLLDLGRTPQFNTADGFGSIKATYFLDSKTFLEISGGMFGYSSRLFDPVLTDNFFAYGDSVANAMAGIVWVRHPGEVTGRFALPRTLSIYGLPFSSPGAPLSAYERFQRSNLSLTAAFSAQIGKIHTIKFGGDYQRFTIRAFRVPSPNSLASVIYSNDTLAGDNPVRRTHEQIMISQGVENYGFDVLGNLTESSGFEGPRHPVYASAYVQDKAEFSDLTLSAGIRYDYVNTNTFIPVDPTHLEYTFDPYTLEVHPGGLKKTTPYHAFSPRIGVAFPASDQTVIHAQYAKLVQQSRLRDVLYGLHRFAYFAQYGGSLEPIGFDLRPERSTQYEIGFTQEIGEFASFDITGYYKDTRDQIVMVQQLSAPDSPFSGYTKFANGDFATSKGIELTFSMRRFQRILASASLAFQDAQGTGSFPTSNRFRIISGEDTALVPLYISPLSYMNDVRGNISLDYRFGPGEGGPILQELGAAVLFQFSSGHPYTRVSPLTGLNVESLNASTTPWTFQVDLRIDKTFRFDGRLRAVATLYVMNLFDTRNIQNVWPATGSPDDDGYLSNPALGGKLVETFGPAYADVRSALQAYSRTDGAFVSDPYLYGPPRQIRVGIKLEY
jgi:outer membrane receptor protein involved in Fe transport